MRDRSRRSVYIRERDMSDPNHIMKVCLGVDHVMGLPGNTISHRALHEVFMDIVSCGDNKVTAGRVDFKLWHLPHYGYAKWLVDDVLGTLGRSDAEKGSLGTWHLVLGWERQVSPAENTRGMHDLFGRHSYV